MDDFLAKELNKRKGFLEKIVLEKSAAIAKAGVEGRLRCVDRNGRGEYYWRNDTSDVNGKYIPADNRGFAAALAQKSYDQMVLKYAQEELRCIDQLTKKRSIHKVEEVYDSYCLPRKALVDPVWIPDDEFVTKWLQTKYNRRRFKDGEKEYYNKRNERVGSKSEILISNMIIDMGIPYLLEFPVFLSTRGWVFPDFMVLNVRTRIFRYWEHYGMMDDPGYCEDNLEKTLAYERDGIFPGTHLIITHETSARPVDMRLIEKVIEHYLL